MSTVKSFNSSSQEIINIKPLFTSSSEFNLTALSEGDADFAIVQEDVLKYTGKEKTSKIKGITPLFKEYVIIFRLTNSTNSSIVTEFDPDVCSNIVIPKLSSGSHLTAENTFSILGVNKNIVTSEDFKSIIIKSIDDIKNKTETPTIFAVFSIENPIIKDILDGKLDGYDSRSSKPTKVYNNESEFKSFRDFYKLIGVDDSTSTNNVYSVDFYSIPIDRVKAISEIYKVYYEDSLKIINNGLIKNHLITISLRTFLLTHNETNASEVSSFITTIFLDSIRLSQAKEVPIENDWVIPVHPGAYDLLISNNLYKANLLAPNSKKYSYIILVLILSLILTVIIVPEKGYHLIFLGRDINMISQVRQYLRNKKLLLGISFLIILFMLSAFFIWDIEKNISNTPPFSEMSLRQIFLWLLLFQVTGSEQNLFPVNPNSGFIILFLEIVIKLFVAIIAYTYVKDFYLSLTKRTPWLKKTLNNHIVFIGYHSSIYDLLKDSLIKDNSLKYVIISDNDLPEIDFESLRNNSTLIKGSLIDKEVLVEKAFILQCKQIIITIPDYKTNVGFPLIFSNYIDKEFPELKNKLFLYNPDNVNTEFYKGLDVKLLNIEDMYEKLVQSVFLGNGLFRFVETSLGIKQEENTVSTGNNLLIEERDLLKPSKNFIGKEYLKDILSISSYKELFIFLKKIEDRLFEINYTLLGCNIKLRTEGSDEEINLNIINPTIKHTIDIEPTYFKIISFKIMISNYS